LIEKLNPKEVAKDKISLAGLADFKDKILTLVCYF